MAEPLITDVRILKELAYYKKQLDRIAGESIRNDFVLSSLRHELKQKKEGFTILTKLQEEFTVTTPLHTIYDKTVKAINNHLGMDRTILFLPGSRFNVFKAGYWYGVDDEQIPLLEMREIELPATQLESCHYILQTRKGNPTEIGNAFQRAFGYEYFIGVPIRFDGNVIAFICTGRRFEKIPFVPPLDRTDLDTLMAISGLLVGIIQNKKMLEMKLQMKEEEDRKREIIQLFGQQVSKDVASTLMNTRLDKGAKKVVAIMFLDIRNFTPFVQHKPPEETVTYLNSLFGFMIDIIDKHRGIVNQFLGDGFMTTFGAPIEDPNPFQNAVDAALEIQKILDQKVERNEIPPTNIGIGIHGGEAITGNVGSHLRKQYTITGNVVIIAARIEQLTKHYSARVLISREVFKKLSDKPPSPRSLGEVQLKGLSESVELYQLL